MDHIRASIPTCDHSSRDFFSHMNHIGGDFFPIDDHSNGDLC